jgi:hypothetical protein
MPCFLKLLTVILGSAISLNGTMTPVAAVTDEIMGILNCPDHSDASVAPSTTYASNIV